MKEVRVRFAPSPTGFLHVGGARTAIFNWLFAKNQGGRFLVRIEDTDIDRSKSELSEQIIRSLKWLDLESDEKIIHQANLKERHREIVIELVKLGKAYCAFETPEELEAKRKASTQKNEFYKYDRAALKLSETDIRDKIESGMPYTVRFRVPDGVTRFNDIVHGDTSFNNEEIDDFIILRSDGSPVYQIAVVVDDHDMGITHVIRGDDHLSNTPKQIMIYNALGWELPIFGHLPMILDEQKKKLSKRRNPVACDEYKEKGYLPEALFNFLTLLGFAPTGQREIISKKELIEEFTFDRVNKKSAVFDMKKLDWINFEYIRASDKKYVIKLIREKLKNNENYSDEYIAKIIDLMSERVTTISEFVETGKYFFEEPDEYDEKGYNKYINNESKNLLGEYMKVLENSEEWNAELLEKELRFFTDKKEVKAAALIHPLRLAITGLTFSAGIFELMEILGKITVLRRINALLGN